MSSYVANYYSLFYNVLLMRKCFWFVLLQRGRTAFAVATAEGFYDGAFLLLEKGAMDTLSMVDIAFCHDITAL